MGRIIHRFLMHASEQIFWRNRSYWLAHYSCKLFLIFVSTSGVVESTLAYIKFCLIARHIFLLFAFLF